MTPAGTLLGAYQWRGGLDSGRSTWSPDARKLAFVGTVNSVSPTRWYVWVMNVNGSGQRRLMRNADDPAWSPSGRQIAFVRGRSIYLMNADGVGDGA